MDAAEDQSGQRVYDVDCQQQSGAHLGSRGEFRRGDKVDTRLGDTGGDRGRRGSTSTCVPLFGGSHGRAVREEGDEKTTRKKGDEEMIAGTSLLRCIVGLPDGSGFPTAASSS